VFTQHLPLLNTRFVCVKVKPGLAAETLNGIRIHAAHVEHGDTSNI